MWRAFGWVHSNLFDMTGLDVSHAVMESIYRQYYDEPRYRPVAMTAQRYAAGLHGRKVGRGFYDYMNGKAVKHEERAIPEADLGRPVWVSGRFPEAGKNSGAACLPLERAVDHAGGLALAATRRRLSRCRAPGRG
jgi:3-hydroxyacyl-CoA dehydrogenase